MSEKDVSLWTEITTYWPGIFVAVITGVGTFLVRTVLTNQKKVTILETEAREREKSRSRDREDLLEVKRDIKTLNDSILTYITKNVS